MSDDPRAGIRIAVGLSGCGKTYGIQNQVFAFIRSGAPCIIIDVMAEWRKVPADLRDLACYVSAGQNVIAAIENALRQGKRLIIIQDGDPCAVFETLCRWVIKRKGSGAVGIAIPEAHEAISKHYLEQAVKKCITQWRHYDLALWLDTQRPALLNTTAFAQACETRIYAIGEDIDLQWVRRLGGKALLEKVQQCADEHRKSKDRGHIPDGRGHHVRLDESRMGPYEVTRL